MAFYNEDDENQDPNNQGPAQTGPGSSVITGGGQGAAPGTQAPLVSGSPDKGGNFVGLKTYIDANKNQASKLGEQTAGVISNSANAARDSVSGLNTKFNQAVDQNTINKDDTATGLIGSTPEALSEDQKNQVKKQYNAAYKGPNALSDLGDTYSQAVKNTNQATQNLTAAETEEGRGNLVKQVNSAPRTKGVTTFDNILLQTGPGRQKLLDVANQNADIKDLMSQSEQSAQQKVGMVDDPNTPDIDESAGAKGTTAKTQADTYKSVQDALAAWKAGFDPRLAAAQDTGLQTRVTSDLTDGDNLLTDETRNLLGINYGDYINRDLLPGYLGQFSPGDVNAANLATPEDYARYGALADIAGIQDRALKPEDVSKAGTAPKFEVKSAVADTPKAKAVVDDYNNKRGIFRSNPMITSQFSGPALDSTPSEIEPFIAYLRSHGTNGLADQFQRTLDEWKSSSGFNKIVQVAKK